jgi:putative ABC transport system permease protein
MIRHLLRLLWNRKRNNLLLAAEIFCAFLVLFGVAIFAVQYASNWLKPLGFDYERVWVVRMNPQERAGDDLEIQRQQRATIARLIRELRTLPQIEVVSASNTAPFINSRWESGDTMLDGRELHFGANRVTDEFRDAINMELLAGRWFSREDDGVAWEPVVVNQRLATFVFGDRDPIGQVIPEKPDSERERAHPDYKPSKPKRVIGVIRDFRQFGELATPDNFMFFRDRLDDAASDESPPHMLTVRLREGTTAAFEEQMVRRLQSVARTWSFDVRTLLNQRDRMLRQYLTPIVSVAIVALFLLLMVALGLTGVVWQNVTQRTREFGLRRAKGATVVNVRAQVLAELLLLTTLALIGGIVLVLQLPLLPMPRDLAGFSPAVFAIAVIASVVVIYLLTLAAGWYPSRMATRIHPAEALHYE